MTETEHEGVVALGVEKNQDLTALVKEWQQARKEVDDLQMLYVGTSSAQSRLRSAELALKLWRDAPIPHPQDILYDMQTDGMERDE